MMKTNTCNLLFCSENGQKIYASLANGDRTLQEGQLFDLDYAMMLQEHFSGRELHALVSHISPSPLNRAVENKGLGDTLPSLSASKYIKQSGRTMVGRYDRIRLIILSIVGEHPLHEVSDTYFECSCHKIELTHSAF